MRVTEVMVEVGTKTIASSDMVLDVGIRHIVIGPKAKVVDKGEEHFDEVWEGQIWVIGHEGALNLGCCTTLPACDYGNSQLEKDVPWKGNISYGAENAELVPEEKILKGVVGEDGW